MIRLATPADADAVARVHVRSFRVAYAGLMPAEFLANLDETARSLRWRAELERGFTLLLSESEAVLCGFCGLSAARDADLPGAGEVRVLYVLPEVWRGGHGRALLSAARERAVTEGYRELAVWVLDTNAAARAFYAREGFVADGAEKLDASFGFPLRDVRLRARL